MTREVNSGTARPEPREEKVSVERRNEQEEGLRLVASSVARSPAALIKKE